MAKTLSPAQEKERAELDSFLSFYSTHVSRIPPDSSIHPRNVGIRIEAQYGPVKAFTGLRQAINDVFEETRPWDLERVVALNEECSKRGLLTLSELRRRYSSRYQSIVKRGRIRSDSEYYLVAGILAGQSQIDSTEDRRKCEEMVSTYEASKNGSKQR